MPEKRLIPLKSRLVAILLAICIPLFGCFFLYSLYSTRLVRRQVAEASQSHAAFLMESIDYKLGTIENYLTFDLGMNDTNISSLQVLSPGSQYTLAQLRLNNRLIADLSADPLLQGVFVYFQPKDELMQSYGGNLSLQAKEAFSRQTREILSGRLSARDRESVWQLYEVGGRPYLAICYSFGDLLIGAWVDVEAVHMAQPGTEDLLAFASADYVSAHRQLISENHVELSQENGYYFSGNPQKYLVVCQRSTQGEFQLVLLKADADITQSLPLFQRAGIFLALLGLALLPVLFYLLRVQLVRPADNIAAIMDHIGAGHTDLRIPAQDTPEFEKIRHSFNQMLDQTQHLRIQLYEQELEEQRLTLQNLQLQISPHFFINALNIIYGFAAVQDYRQIQDLSQSITQYLRYLYKSGLALVPLCEELEHVQNYLEIQSVRYPDRFLYLLDAPPELARMGVPQLAVHTFVENSLKYALGSVPILEISVTCRLLKGPRGGRIQIQIQDNGCGFPPQVLACLKQGVPVVDQEGQSHIGITNLQQRLRHSFSTECDLSLRNLSEGGAEVFLEFPAKEEATGHELIDRR